MNGLLQHIQILLKLGKAYNNIYRAKGLSIEDIPVSSGGGSLEMQTFALFGAKTSGFSNLWCIHKAGGLSQCE